MPQPTEVYLCSRCLTVSGQAGPCSRCGKPRLGCRPGDPDDPCRRPLMDESGQILTRAPIWWLCKSVPELAKILDLG